MYYNHIDEPEAMHWDTALMYAQLEISSIIQFNVIGSLFAYLSVLYKRFTKTIYIPYLQGAAKPIKRFGGICSGVVKGAKRCI